MAAMPFSVRLTEEELARLDAERERFGVSRSGYVRLILETVWREGAVTARLEEKIDRLLDAVERGAVLAPASGSTRAATEQETETLRQSVDNLLDGWG